jgi:hypothetical protein
MSKGGQDPVPRKPWPRCCSSAVPAVLSRITWRTMRAADISCVASNLNRHKAVFLPVDSISAAAGRWVTPDPRKHASESDFDSVAPSVLASSQRTRGRGEDQTRPCGGGFGRTVRCFNSSPLQALSCSPLSLWPLLRRRLYQSSFSPANTLADVPRVEVTHVQSLVLGDGRSRDRWPLHR